MVMLNLALIESKRITVQQIAAAKPSTMNKKSSFVKVPVVNTKQLVITKQLKLYF
jgi:hypothetical protein